MARPSFLRVLRVPPEQYTAILLALTTIEVTIIVPIIQAIPFPFSLIFGPLIIALLAGLPNYYCIKKMTRKELIYSITNQLSVVNDLVSVALRRRITLLFDKYGPYPNLHTALLNIHNKGNAHIEEKDFSGKSLRITLPAEVELIEADVREPNPSNITIDTAKPVNNGIALKPFALAAQGSFNLRLTFNYEGRDVLEKLQRIKLEAEDEAEPGFKFEMFPGEEWKEIVKRRTVRHNRWFLALLSAVSVLSLAICVYVCFFSGKLPFLSLAYELILVICLTIFYFALLLSLLFNRLAPPSTA